MTDHETLLLMQPNYDLPWILPYVRASLKERHNLDFDAFVDGVLAVLAKNNVSSVVKTAPPQSTRRAYDLNRLDNDIKVAITEAFHYVEQNRFILFQRDNTLNFTGSSNRWLITKRGVEWANGVEPLPEDYDGYMKQFGASTDAVVREYMGEALNSFIHRNFFATAVMIGAASEKTIYLLADSLVPALTDAAKKTELTIRIGSRRMEKLFQFVEEIVIDGQTVRNIGGQRRSIIPFDVMGGSARHLLSIFDHIRLQRNDAIHPINFVVSPDSVRAALTSFPLAFEKVDALRQWCNANPGLL